MTPPAHPPADAPNGDAEDDPEDDLDDAALFRREVASLGRGRNYPRARRPAEESAPAPAARGRQTPSDEPAGSGVLLDQIEHGDRVMFAVDGLQKKVLRKLKRGDYDCAAVLDLHGHTVAEAERLLDKFLRRANPPGDPVLHIIHGKGLHSGGVGVLKQFTQDFLQQHPLVKAFCSAQPRDGGTGAVYVLLRAGGKSSRARR